MEENPSSRKVPRPSISAMRKIVAMVWPRSVLSSCASSWSSSRADFVLIVLAYHAVSAPPETHQNRPGLVIFATFSANTRRARVARRAAQRVLRDVFSDSPSRRRELPKYLSTSFLKILEKRIALAGYGPATSVPNSIDGTAKSGVAHER